jgi:hypothetical protein
VEYRGEVETPDSWRCTHHVEVNAAVDAVYSSAAMQLPDEPSIEVRTKKETVVP